MRWKLDENGGAAAADSSGSGNTGTLMSGATWIAGKVGSAVKLDGADDFVTIPDQPALRLTTAMTVATWVRVDGAPSDWVRQTRTEADKDRIIYMLSRVRYFTDGVVLGSREYVEDMFRKHRGEFGVKRKTGARNMRWVDWQGLCTIRDLRKENCIFFVGNPVWRWNTDGDKEPTCDQRLRTT